MDPAMIVSYESRLQHNLSVLKKRRVELENERAEIEKRRSAIDILLYENRSEIYGIYGERAALSHIEGTIEGIRRCDEDARKYYAVSGEHTYFAAHSSVRSKYQPEHCLCCGLYISCVKVTIHSLGIGDYHYGSHNNGFCKHAVDVYACLSCLTELPPRIASLIAYAQRAYNNHMHYPAALRLLLHARSRQPGSVFHKDFLCRDVFKVILRLVFPDAFLLIK